jgi:hypothetical protein
MDPQPLTVATLNTRGSPLSGSSIGRRYRAIGESFEASDVDVLCVQEVLTPYHLRHLTAGMPSFRYVRRGRSPVGAAGGLVTLARRPLGPARYHRLPPPPTGRLPRHTWLLALLKGVLVTRVGSDGPWILNTHLGPNHDGDWSDTNRHGPLHRHQLDALAAVVRPLGPAARVVCGDFNVAAGSTFLRGLLADAGLVDAFGDDCRPTFRAEFLGPGQTAHRIDFVLTTGPVTVTGTDLLLTGAYPFPAGPAYLSDHLGLRAALSWTRVGAGPRT